MKRGYYPRKRIVGKSLDLPNRRKIGVYRHSNLFVIVAERPVGWCQIKQTQLVLSAEAFDGLLLCAESLLNEDTTEGG